MMKKNKLQNSAGFTLVEMAVVIIIAGFIFVPLMSVFIQKERKESQEKTIENDERIVNAIHFFVTKNGRYPCPAALDKGPSETAYGEESCTTGTAVLQGAVPVVTLGIPAQWSANENGWKYFYAVTTAFTNLSTFNSQTDGDITVITPNGNTATGVKTEYILVNAGKDGKGSYSLYGDANVLTCTAASTARDAENCDGDALFIDAPLYLTGSPAASGYYDDKISYGSATQANDFWMTRPVSSLTNKKALLNRTAGNVGIGKAEPDSKLHIAGNVALETEFGGTGGQVIVHSDIDADELKSGTNTDAQTLIVAAHFCPGQYNPASETDTTVEPCCTGEVIGDATAGYQCCEDGSYVDSDGNQMCKPIEGNCSIGTEGNYDDGEACCYRYQTDINGACCTGTLDSNGVCEEAEGENSCSGVDDTGDCCDPSDGFCCPTSVYDAGGNCYLYWD